MVDQLARDYVSQPVVFLEQGVAAPMGARYDRFWAAFGGGTATYPLIIVDSGHQVKTGYTSDQYNVYKGLVEAELARAPQAALEAYSWRVGAQVHFSGKLTNLSGQTLSASQNGATLHALVYEDAKVGVTSRYVRAAVYTPLSSALASGASATFTLDTPDLSGVDWTKLHMLVLADYRPGGTTGAYDMLQAAFAVSPTFTVTPNPLVFLSSDANGVAQPVALNFQGPAALTWTAVENLPWLTLSAYSGSLAAPPVASVIPTLLSAGWQTGTVTFTATNSGDLLLTQVVPVSAYVGGVRRLNLPFIVR